MPRSLREDSQNSPRKQFAMFVKTFFRCWADSDINVQRCKCRFGDVIYLQRDQTSNNFLI